MDRAPSELDIRLAAELDHARDMLIMMGDELAMDFAIVSRHGLPLQAVDIVSQMLGHIASVVRSNDRRSAVESIGMCDLRAKLADAA
jgi:hypothetical protein